MKRLWLLTSCALLCAVTTAAQQKAPAQKTFPTAAPSGNSAAAGKNRAQNGGPASFADLSKTPTLYAVAYAHLDTQWRWEYPQTISEYLPKTMRSNFALFEKYPHYIFNFTGANRYRLMKEYYPQDFARLKQYVAAGRWYPAGSSMEEGDVNAPNAEFIIRQVLYGNNWFRREFGIASAEFMLPDCFGFPASLPTILTHAGVKGFSTQKLSSNWQPAPHVGGPDSPEKSPEGIPFNVGLWEGPDGTRILAALNPLSYTSEVDYDLSKTPPAAPPPPANPPANFRQRTLEDWPKRLQINGQLTGIFADYHYVGTGDIGGAPSETSVRLMEAIQTRSKAVLPALRFNFVRNQPIDPLPPPGPPVTVGDGPVRAVFTKADQMFLDILKCCSTDKMPRYKGDLELINHSAGSLTSQAYHKRWNRMNEVLGDAAEKASLVAEWLGGRRYPLERLNNAWTLVMGGHFHDNMAGTATPKAYEFTWNDDVLALNQFASVLTDATQSVASALDTQGPGTALVVYNALNIPREDVVDATVSLPHASAVRVTGPDGKPVPAQVLSSNDTFTRILFIARVPSVGYAVYNVQPGDGGATEAALHATDSALENERYAIKLNEAGDVASIFDKKLKRELLASPLRLAISTDNPQFWPAWNMDFEDEQRAPRAYVGGPAKVRVVESGPVRVAVQVTRDTEGSHFEQTVRLSAGDAGSRVEFANAIDWLTKGANLKATFPLSAVNKMATYNWDIGTIQRPNAEERQFEVASHQWIDLADQSGQFGVTVLTDAKNGSDKPNDNTLRLTLVRTPGTRGSYTDQGTQDLGHHEFVFGLAGHDGNWQKAETDWQAYRLNQPLLAFESARHPGALGKTFSLLKLSSSRVRVMALKKAERTDETIVRVVEVDGKEQRKLRIAFPKAIQAAREVNGQEQAVGPATVANGELITPLKPYQPRTFAVKLAAAPARVMPPRSQPVALAYDVSVATHDGRPTEGCFDCSLNRPTASQGKSLPAEMLPATIDLGGVRFRLAPAGTLNAVTARGQQIKLPAGNFKRAVLLAAAMGGDQRATVRAGGQPIELNIQDWTGYIGQWDNRGWESKDEKVSLPGTNNAQTVRAQVFNGVITPGFIKPATVAWFASHRHASDGANEPYQYSYLFAYPIALPSGATTLTLPDNERIRILAISVSEEGSDLRPAQPLYDTLVREGAAQ